MTKHILDQFERPKSDFEEPTVGEFYEKVDHLVNVLQELDQEENQRDEEMIDKYLKIITDLKSDLKFLNESKHSYDVSSVIPNNTIIDTVSQIWKDFINDANEDLMAKIKQLLKDSNLKNIVATRKQLKALLRKHASENLRGPLERIDPRGFVSKLQCESDELPCDDEEKCYKKSQKCNRYRNCKDNSDEKDCKCKDYLDSNRICDGYPDCPDVSDELGCSCKVDQHFCGKDVQGSNVCIDNDRRCDNVVDCRKSSNDEFNCFALSRAPIRQLIAKQDLEGFLHVNRDDRWFILALDITDEEKEEYRELIQDLGREVCTSTITRGKNLVDVQVVDFEESVPVAHLSVNLNPNNVALDRFYQSAGRFSFTILKPFTNLTKALKVNCGEPKCGQAVNQGNSPFARFDLGNDYKRPDSSAAAEVRIVGGQDSRPTKWPFLVSLHRDGLFKCGAVIIDKDWVLTAAHCVNRNSSHYQVYTYFVICLFDQEMISNFFRFALEFFANFQ